MGSRNRDERSEAQKAKDREEIALLYFDRTAKPRWTQEKIATRLNISQPTVSRDIAYLKKQWEKKAARKVIEHQAEALSELDAIKAEAWEAWQKSKNIAMLAGKIARAGEIGEFPGDPRYLGIIQGSIVEEMKIVGGEAATRLRFGEGENDGLPIFNFNFHQVPARAEPPTLPDPDGVDAHAADL